MEEFRLKSQVNVRSFAFLSLKTMLKSSQSYNEATKTLISQLIFPNANVVAALLVKQTLTQWLLLLRDIRVMDSQNGLDILSMSYAQHCQ